MGTYAFNWKRVGRGPMQFFHISVGSFPPVQTAECVCPVRLCRIVLFNVLSAWGRENNKGIDWARRARMKEPGWSGLPLGFILIRLIACYCIQLGWSSAQNVCIKTLPSLFPNREWAGGIMVHVRLQDKSNSFNTTRHYCNGSIVHTL